FGAYAAMSETLKKYLINTCRSFIYSTALPPSIIAADSAAIDLVEREPYRRKTLLANASYVRERLRESGFDLRGESQIIPVIAGKNRDAVAMSEHLRGKGYWVMPVRPPTVPKGEARLRLSLTFDHKREILDSFIEDIRGL
ncbi:aminotransferase class I/II-fold pyridoxal phosphate-dependent enzyme, partial [Candidatus Omnitrophota bacterium]